MVKSKGKSSSKGKDKKLARKAASERAAALAARVKALEAGSACGADLAAQFPAFLRYRRNGLAAALRFFAAAELPAELLEWALGLTRTHMAALYEACPGWGWSDAKKRAELAHPSARYLIVFEEEQQAPCAAAAAAAVGETESATGSSAASREVTGQAAVPAPGSQENSAAAGNGGGGSSGCAASTQRAQGGGQQQQGRPLAFLHYRYEEEEGEAVLYCYEIQVDAAAQGKGLGRFLMQLLELMGRRSGVARLMLTVFHANSAAAALYRRLGYVLDADSPGAVDPSGDHKYEIMTKFLQPAQPAQQAQHHPQQPPAVVIKA